MTYLITGGTGNLARQLAGLLAADGARVVLFDRAEPPAGSVGQFVRGDVTRADDLDDALRQFQPRIVLHMASMLSGSCEQDRAAGWGVNVTATFHLFEALRRHGVQTLFFPSSLATYGNPAPDPLPPDHAQWPDGIYGVTKVTCERLGHYYHRAHGLDFRCLRLPMVISRFAPAGAASAYASRAFVEAVSTGRFTFRVNPSTACCTAYVQDVVAGIHRFIAAPASRLSRRVYNIHALAPTARELGEAIIARLSPMDIRFDPDPAVVRLIESWPKHVVDDDARHDWGWAPRYDLDALADHFIAELQREFAGRF